MSILGFDFHQGPEVAPPEPIDFTTAGTEDRRKAWADVMLDGVRYHDAWAVLVTKPNADVLLFDVRPESLWEATGWGGTAHLLLAREASTRRPG